MDDTFNFDAPLAGQFPNPDMPQEPESFGETENFFSVPYFQRHERRNRPKSAKKAKLAEKQVQVEETGSAEPESIEAQRSEAPAKRRKVQISKFAAPKTSKTVTVPKAPSFMSRNAKSEKKKNQSGNLSEFYKPFPTTAPDTKQKRKTTICQPFSFMAREENKKLERDNRKREKMETVSDDEITFRPPIRRKQKPRSKSTNNVFDRLAKPKVPKDNTGALRNGDSNPVLAPPAKIKRKEWAPTKAVTPNLLVKKRAVVRKVLKDQNAARAEEDAAVIAAEKAEQQLREEKQLQEERAQTVHRPTTIRRYKDVPPRVTSATTVAVTPDLKTRKRQRQ